MDSRLFVRIKAADLSRLISPYGPSDTHRSVVIGVVPLAAMLQRSVLQQTVS